MRGGGPWLWGTGGKDALLTGHATTRPRGHSLPGTLTLSLTVPYPPAAGTLSSYCYVLMCIHLLQTRPVPVLPVLQQLPPTFRRTVGQWTCEFCDDVSRGGRGCMHGWLWRAKHRPTWHASLHHAFSLPQPLSPCVVVVLSAPPDYVPPPTPPQVASLRGFGSANRENLAELLWAFFEYWAWCAAGGCRGSSSAHGSRAGCGEDSARHVQL